MTHVLIVEDDPMLRRSLVLNLTARGYTIDDTGNGEDALRLAGRRLPDVVLVDLGLPGISGLDVITGLRAWSDVPIIVLSARGAERDKVEALDAGATDYVTKPFGIDELLARLRVAERIRAAQRPADGPIRTPDFTIDLDAHRVTRDDGAELHLTPIEWALLAHLARRPGRLVTHAELLTAIWGPTYGTETNYLRVHVTHLRKKIEPDPSRPAYVITEPGVGYRFDGRRAVGT
jgi:two-component system KDP operon response regulator KdpE